MDWRRELDSVRPFLFSTGNLLCVIGIVIAAFGLQIVVLESHSRGDADLAVPFALFFIVLGMLILAVGWLMRWRPLGWRWWIAFPIAFVAGFVDPAKGRPTRLRAVRTPSLNHTFRDLAYAQEAIHEWRGEYTRQLDELGPLVLPSETRAMILSATTRSYAIRVDSGTPVARSCIVRGNQPIPGGFPEFYVECAEPDGPVPSRGIPRRQ